MTLAQIGSPFPVFTGLDGSPLDNGYVWIGVADLNPETNPIEVFYDAALTEPAPSGSPFRTSNGYIMRNGAPANLYVDGPFSVTVREKDRRLVVYSPQGYQAAPAGVFLEAENNLSDVASIPAAQANIEVTRYATRAAFVADTGYTPAAGTVATAGGLSYVRTTGATAIPDLLGWLPFGDVTPLHFGAVGDGTADDTDAIQAAIDSGFARLTSPEGSTYRITDTLSINRSNIELSFNHSTVNLDDASGSLDHIFLGDGVTQKTAIRLRNMTLTREQIATSGYAINSNYIGVTEISGFRIFGNNRIHGGIRIFRGTLVNIFDNFIDYCIRWGIDLEGTDAVTNRTIDICIRENRVEGGESALRTWDFVEGIFCRDNIFYDTSGSAVSISASSNANGLLSFKLQENDFDKCGGSGVFLDKVNNVQITGCWFAGTDAAGIQLKSDAAAIIVADNQMYPFAQGMIIEAADVRINGNLISGGTTCIEVGSGAARVGIVGNTLQNANVGVDLNSAAAVNAVGNFFSGITTNEFQNVGTSASIHNNKGDRAIGQNAFISVGASPFTYTAGVRPEYVSVFAGSVSEIRIGSNAISLVTNAQVMLNPGQSMTVTYSSIPFMVYNVL